MSALHKNKSLSRIYYKRKHHIFFKRLSFAFVVTLSILFLLSLSFFEGLAVRLLLSEVASTAEFFIFVPCIFIFLFIYNLILARVSLYICYHFENINMHSALFMLSFTLVYLFFSFKFHHLRNVIPLDVSKLFIISLYFRFWAARLSQARLKTQNVVLPRIFLVSWRAFFTCRFVLTACFLLSALGFVFALVSAHPAISLAGWEGLLVMSIFYFLFRFFVQNPNAL